MGKLIINADDYGYSSGVNYGIIHAHQRGVLTSTTMMANMPGFEEGIKLAKKNPDLGIGVHLVLTAGSPLSKDVPSLTNNNKFHHLSYYEKKFEIDLNELYIEWKMQIDKIIDHGINPTHLDSHHHINSIYPLSKIFTKLAKEYDLPVRNNYNVPKEIKTTDRFINTLDSLSQTKDIWKHMSLNNLIADCYKYETIEAICHPAYVDSTLIKGSSFTTKRTFVLEELISLKDSSFFSNKDIELVNFNKIVK